MNSRSAVKLLLVFVLGLPILLAVLGWTRGLLAAMGDESAATILGHINTSTSVLWLATVVGLVVALAVDSLDGPREE